MIGNVYLIKNRKWVVTENYGNNLWGLKPFNHDNKPCRILKFSEKELWKRKLDIKGTLKNKLLVSG